MRKKSALLQNLNGLFQTFLERDNPEELITYLVLNSSLPGPRANLELGEAFVEVKGLFLRKYGDLINR
ncbi:hypothetical protein ACFLTP_02860 [Chloroflexota bacterium]